MAAARAGARTRWWGFFLILPSLEHLLLRDPHANLDVGPQSGSLGLFAGPNERNVVSFAVTHEGHLFFLLATKMNKIEGNWGFMVSFPPSPRQLSSHTRPASPRKNQGRYVTVSLFARRTGSGTSPAWFAWRWFSCFGLGN